jgi:PST family polysaccharide transporter
VRGVIWTGGGQVVLQLVQVGTSIALARLLAPEHFGIIGMAMVFVGFAQLLADFGLGTAIVQARTADAIALSSAFWLNTAIGLGLTVAAVALSPVFAELYEHAETRDVMAVLSLSLLPAALTAVPTAILYRAMDFAAMAKIRIVASFVAACAAIAMAISGYGVWSLVAQPLVGAVTSLVLTWWFTRWLPRLVFSMGSIKGMVGFSAAVLGNSVLYHLNRNTDSFLIGKYLGSQPLGYYAMAYQLMLYPINQVSSVIVRVLFPTLAQLRDDPDYFRRAYLKSVVAVSFVAFPIMLGLIAVTHDFIIVVFGEKWLPMQNLVKILAVVGLAQSITTGVSSMLLSTGRAKTALVLSVVGCVACLSAFIVGLRWGVEGVASAYAIVFLLVQQAYIAYVFRLVGLSVRAFYRALAPSAIAAALMFAAVVLCLYLCEPLDLAPAIRLTIGVMVGVVAYVAASFAINRAEILTMWALVTASLRKS